MNVEIYILPALILTLLIYALIKKIPSYTSFAEGAKAALKLCADIFPYIAAVFICVQLFKASGLSRWLSSALAPAFDLMGIPPELCELILIRPFSGNASLALLSEIYKTYGTDSYVARCASTIAGSSDTVFYITAVYFAGTKVKRFRYAIPVALLANLFSAILACLIVRFF
ncbi:MAG: spore maturation protein [Clostridiales bacterium]|nr:spore maturation protein [Clostridiales bacterium]